MTDINVWRSKLLRDIEQAGLLRQPRQIKLNSGALAVAGRVDIAGHSVGIAVSVDPMWNNHLPKFFLHPKEALGFIPHIDSEGVVCFLEAEGIQGHRTFFCKAHYVWAQIVVGGDTVRSRKVFYCLHRPNRHRYRATPACCFCCSPVSVLLLAGVEKQERLTLFSSYSAFQSGKRHTGNHAMALGGDHLRSAPTT